MEMWKRFRDIMKSNINSLLARSDQPEQAVQTYIRNLNSDLGQVKAETAAVVAEENRAKRLLDESNAEISKLHRYAERSAQSGDETQARQFLEKKAQLTNDQHELQAAYERTAAKVSMMKHMQDKLVGDLSQLEQRYAELKSKMAAVQARQQENERQGSYGSREEALQAMEDKASMAMHEAEALAEVRGGSQEEDLDVLIARLEEQMNAQPAAAVDPAQAAEQELHTLQQNKES